MLYDVDKNSEDRGSPMPNHDDKLIGGAIKSHKTLSTHYTTDADTNPGRLQMQNKQILGNDGTTNITLYGYNQALNQWGFFVTQAGTEVTTNTDLSKFIFNSNQDIFKIVKTMTVSVSFTLNASAATFGLTKTPHGLSFTPAYMAFINLDSTFASGTDIGTSNVHNPYTQFVIAGGTTLQPQLWAGVTVDSTNVNFETITRIFGSSTVTNTAKVYLLQETQT